MTEIDRTAELRGSVVSGAGGASVVPGAPMAFGALNHQGGIFPRRCVWVPALAG